MNRTLPEMLHCLNTSGNFAGNGTDITVLERQRGRMKWQQEQLLQQQNYFSGNEYNLFAQATEGQQQLQCLINGSSGLDQLVTPTVKPDPGVENGWVDYGKYALPGTEFGGDNTGCGYVNGSVFEMNYGLSRTASCPPAVAAAALAVCKGRETVSTEKLSSTSGKESFKKRKADKVQNPKVIAEDENKDKKIKGCAEEGDSKSTEQNRETSTDTSKENSKVTEVQKTDYIHVRARRGQATDSHSLAERVRREKISERMKYLQDLVPGCNKITGKAGMLDEIINYVQSLQRQVEFLSMKLATVNTKLDFDIDNLFAKEVFPACSASIPTIGVSSEMANPAYLQFNPCSLEMGMNPIDLGLRRTISAPVSIPEALLDTSCFTQTQPSSTWEADLVNLYGVEFHPGRPTSYPMSQPFTGSFEANNLKMEM